LRGSQLSNFNADMFLALSCCGPVKWEVVTTRLAPNGGFIFYFFGKRANLYWR